MSESNELVAASSGDFVADLVNNRPTLYTSIKGEDFETRKRVLAALGASAKVDDNLGKAFMLKDVIVQSIEMPDERTGELVNVPRVILIDDKGGAMVAVSSGLLRSIQNFIGTLGEPQTWPGAVKVKVVEAKARSGYKFFTLELA